MKKLLKILPIVIVLSLIAFVALNLFKIKTVEISGNSCIKKEETFSQKGKLFFAVDEKELEKKVIEKYSCVKSALIKKKFPNKIIVEAQAFEEVAQLEDTNLSVTQAGQLKEGVREGLPKVYLLNKEELKTGNKIEDPTSLFAVNLAALITKTDFQVLTIRVLNPTEIIAYQKDETIAVFTSGKSAESQVDSLQQVASLAKIDHDKIAKVDLRFDKPIIVEK